MIFFTLHAIYYAFAMAFSMLKLVKQLKRLYKEKNRKILNSRKNHVNRHTKQAKGCVRNLEPNIKVINTFHWQTRNCLNHHIVKTTVQIPKDCPVYPLLAPLDPFSGDQPNVRSQRSHLNWRTLPVRMCVLGSLVSLVMSPEENKRSSCCAPSCSFCTPPFSSHPFNVVFYFIPVSRASVECVCVVFFL